MKVRDKNLQLIRPHLRRWPNKSSLLCFQTALLTIILRVEASIFSSSNISSQTFQNNNNGFQLYTLTNEISPNSNPNSNQSQPTTTTTTTTQQPLQGFPQQASIPQKQIQTDSQQQVCTNGLLTFELSTGFIYKPSSPETLAMMPGTLQLTDCLDFCLQNASCLAINFEMGLCVLLSSSAKQNLQNLYSSQFPVFTIYAEKKCLLSGDPQVNKQRRRCQRAWTFERVAGYEMKTRPRKKLKLANKEQCMESCLIEREFECRSANWFRQSNECTLSDQDRHSVSQSEAGDQQIKSSLHNFYGPSNQTLPNRLNSQIQQPTLAPGLYQNYYINREALLNQNGSANELSNESSLKYRKFRQLFSENMKLNLNSKTRDSSESSPSSWPSYYSTNVDNLLPANAAVDYLENNCVYEPNKLCEFRKIQNRVLKTVDSIYQDVNNLEECKQKCLNAPYRCYSFDYGDTSERVCRTSHLDQASLLSVKEPYLDVVGAITYELASCFNVSIHCRAREMVAVVSSSKMFKGKIYVKSRPSSCVNDVRESLKFELAMRYNDDLCNVQASANSQQGVFSNDIVIQHHDRIVTTQDVGLSVYCQYDLGNKSITNNVDLAIEKLDESSGNQIESKTKPGASSLTNGEQLNGSGSGQQANSPLTITSLATTVVKSPNVTMRITNMNGQPVASATVGDRLALLFEIKEKTSPFGIFVREIIAMDGRQVSMITQPSGTTNKFANKPSYHYANNLLANFSEETNFSTEKFATANEIALENAFQANRANSVQFIDADGCPTDANIMGPLVKMDPAGHRILAPFDAFKFPTSDMVFFRAVVSSCVSECKPAVCGGSTAVSNFPTGLMNTDTTALTELISTTQTESKQNNEILDLHPTTTSYSTTTTTTSHHLTSPYAQLTSSLTRWANNSAPPEQLLAEILKNKTRSTTPLPISLEKTRADLLTTIAGFSSTSTTSATPTTIVTVPQDSSNNLIPTEQNMLDYASPNATTTNNHQHGKPPPRPNVVQQTGNSINLDALSQQQKQQLVKLFESKLKQQLVGGAAATTTGSGAANNGGGALSEMADLYTGLISSVLLNAANEQHKATNTDNNLKQVSLSASGVAGENPDTNLEAFLAYLLRGANLTAVANSLQIQRKIDSAAISRLLNQQEPRDKSNLIGRNPSDGQSANSVAPDSMTINNNRAEASHQLNLKQGKRSTEGATSNLHNQSSKLRVQPNQNQSIIEQRKRQQAFADAYLGAFQSYGRRRRRRKRQVEQLSSEYIYSEQPQVADGELRFTSGVVEMFHTSDNPKRSKRELKLEQPDQMEELIIQAIRIHERPTEVNERQKEEKQTEFRQKANNLPKNKLVTGSQRDIVEAETNGDGIKTDEEEEKEQQQQMLQEGEEAAGWAGQARMVPWSSSPGALSFMVLALVFIFVQVFLVVIYFLDLNRRQALKRRLIASTSNRLLNPPSPSMISVASIENCRQNQWWRADEEAFFWQLAKDRRQQVS